ncbi:hypothetical protein E4T56_gene10241 [Termitomyces sp. T112]|nr:hypothetical protein E4T56_gene10241 [Termitomyces sp. T112]
MRDNKHFTTFIVWFEWEAYETGWNYNALRFALHHALPQQIKDVLCLVPKQATYDRYKALVTQVDQRYWEDRSENTAPWTPWNASGNTNWQAGATNGVRSSIPANPANPAPRFPLGQGITRTNPPLGQHLLAQLDAADLYETPEPLDTNPDDHNNILDPANDQEALCANRIQDSPWIDVPEETREKQWKEGTCILCVYGKQVSGLGLEDALDHGPDPDVFSAPATLCATILTLDSPPVHLPSHSSTNLLLRTTLPFTANPVPTLVDSSATNNFIDESLAVFPALVDSGASGTFVSNQLSLRRNDLNKPLELQLFDRSPTTTRITQYHDNTLTLDNDLQFQAWLLVTQLPPLTPIVLRLSCLQDINPNINWKDLTMQFPGPKASLAAAIPLRLQSISDSDISHPGTSTSGNRYKGPQYPDLRSSTNSATTPDLSATTLTSNSVNSGSLDIKIVGAVPFARLLQDSTPAFQLQITPALPEEHLCTGTTMPESKTEEQILSKVVSPEYHEFADVFSEGSAKELPPHRSYDHKIDLEEDTSPLFSKIYNMSEVELQALKEYLNDMLGKGFIRSSISTANTLVLFAKKKDGSL